MKPPHNNRQGRGPSDRPPFREGGARPAGNVSGPNGRDGGRDRPQGGGNAGKPSGGNRLTLGGTPDPRNRDQKPRPPGDGFQPRDGQRHSPPNRPHHDGPKTGPDAPKGAVWLYGHHAVAAALKNPSRRLRRLLLTEEAEGAIAKHVPQPWAMAVERVERARLDTLLGRDIVHQGAALLADPLAQPSLQSVLEKPGPIVVLDQVSDPRNVGAIMRSAAAFGAAAVIAQDRNAPEETGALAKAASGALETLPLLRAVNIARTIIALKAANVWCIGLDAGGKPLSGPAFSDRRVALVLGAEGEGLRRLTRETCDEVAGLAIKGAVESLNVSAAAAIALYELTRR
jgi:23S rRNA (guanosine2251-2'-O)-methyltransferase